jgi:hypothetical protein
MTACRAGGARQERVLRTRFGIGMNTDHSGRGGAAVQRDARAHPPDRDEGAAEADASEPVAEAAVVPG